MERKVLSKAAHVVMLTAHSHRASVAHGVISEQRSSVIPDAVDVEHFRSLASPENVEAFRRSFALPREKKIVAYVGRIAREKGWRDLVAVIEQFSSEPVHFLICGDGNERDLLEKELDKRALTPHVTITGYLGIDEVPAAMGVADLLVLVSKHEEFGGVMIEGMAVGTPTVAYSVGGVPYVQRDAETGILVPPGDIDAMAKEIRGLLKDVDKRRRLAKAGLAHARAQFNLPAVCRRIQEIYQGVMCGTGR